MRHLSPCEGIKVSLDNLGGSKKSHKISGSEIAQYGIEGVEM
jgi:hypothetical protein